MATSSNHRLAGCLLILLATGTSLANDAPRPNIVLVMCDDLGYSDVGFNGAKDIRTPHLDALAGAGTILTSGYVAHPFCGPSRMGLMAGRYPHAFGASYNLPNSGLDIDAWRDEGIPVDETLMSTVLQKAGYRTGAIGKWHLGHAKPFHPNVRGFDDFFGFLGGGHMYFPERYQPIYQRQKSTGKTVFNEYITPLEHNGEDVDETEYMTDALSREAVRFVRESAEKDAPFFLYLAYNAPHTPLEATEADLALYQDIKDEKRRTYAAMVHAVDRGIGKLTAALKETGEYENTLVVFLSDNGGKTSAGATNRPLAKGKGSVFEGGIRVPMFFTWPKQVPAGKRYDHPVTAIDFYPTFAGLAGAEIPEAKVLDGRDVWADFLADRDPRATSPIFAKRHRAGISDVSVRDGRWKAVRWGGVKQPWSLFDLDADVGEKNDVATEHPDVVRRLVGAAGVWSRDHTEPKWFDNPKAAETWKSTGMPNKAIYELAP